MTSEERPRTRRNREVLLDELVVVFLAEGFTHLGVADLAARLRCSRSTLYAVAPSKEQLVLAAVRHFFRRATERIEPAVRAEPDPGRRLGAYLAAVAQELAPAGAAFHADLAGHPPAEELYRANTERAARRVQELVDDGVRAGRMRPVDARFVGAAVAEVMAGIQRGVLHERTGLADAEAYLALADLVTRGVGAHGPRSPGGTAESVRT